MSVTSSKRGGRAVIEKRRPIRDVDLLRERDRSMFAKYCEGHRASEVGRIFGVSESLVCRRIKAMPASVRSAVRKDVERQRRVRLSYLRDEAEGQAAHA